MRRLAIVAGPRGDRDPSNPAISQQHGFVHAGAISAIADTAAGYAALSLMPAGRGVLTTEFKINLVSPAVGDRMIARGRVVKAGRTLTLAQTEVFAERGGQEKLIALLTATMMTIEGREGISDSGAPPFSHSSTPPRTIRNNGCNCGRLMCSCLPSASDRESPVRHEGATRVSTWPRVTAMMLDFLARPIFFEENL